MQHYDAIFIFILPDQSVLPERHLPPRYDNYSTLSPPLTPTASEGSTGHQSRPTSPARVLPKESQPITTSPSAKAMTPLNIPRVTPQQHSGCQVSPAASRNSFLSGSPKYHEVTAAPCNQVVMSTRSCNTSTLTNRDSNSPNSELSDDSVISVSNFHVLLKCTNLF